MFSSLEVRLVQRGLLTLPKPVREAYNLEPGATITLLDLGGVFVLSPRRSEIDALADRVARQLAEKGETLESMLKALREAREGYDPEI